MAIAEKTTARADKIELTPLMKVGHALVNQAMGLDTGLTTEQLEHVYADLEDHAVCEEGNRLLIKLLGADWNVRDCGGCEQCQGDDEEVDEDDAGIACALQEAYDECESADDVINILAAALMNVARVNRMEEVALTAHKIWFAN